MTGRHAWDEMRPLLDAGVIDDGHYNPSEQCELHFKVLSVHQSAAYWEVTLFFAGHAVDADCTCPHGYAVKDDLRAARDRLSSGCSRPSLAVASRPAAMRLSSASTRVLVSSRYGASTIPGCGVRGRATSACCHASRMR